MGEFILGLSHTKSYTHWHGWAQRVTLATQTSLHHKRVCTRTHRRVHTKRVPPPTPTDTQPHPSVSVRMTGREPRVGGDAWGLKVTQPQAVKHSPDHNHPTHRNPRNPQTHAHSDTAHMINTTHTHTPDAKKYLYYTCSRTLLDT